MLNRRNSTNQLRGLAGLITLLLLAFSTAQAFASNSTTSPDPARPLEAPSLALDSSGNPVLSYSDQNDAVIKLLHCNDPDCDGGDESIEILEDFDVQSAFWTSLALDESGYPVVSYSDLRDGELRVVHCNDAHCSGGDESITTPANGVLVGGFGSMVLDSSGYPVISYVGIYTDDIEAHRLTVLHCNDANCSGGDESIVVVSETNAPPAIGYDTSLALDSSGNPVVSYFDAATDRRDMRLLHCNDPHCDGGDESITTVASNGDVGFYSSLALDSSGNPVIAYYGSDTLHVVHCNDPNCDGGDDTATTPESEVPGGFHPSLALDANGYPVVAYTTFSGVRLLHCNDANCAGGDESIVAPVDHPGLEFSLRLDSGGSPVVAYVDTGSNLQLLHCGNPFCSADANAAPTANPGGPYLETIDTTIQFDGSASSDPDGDALSYTWEFGDGSSGTGVTPAHSYAASGIYDVCLVVNDSVLDSAPVCTMAVVYDPSDGFVTGGGWMDSAAGAYRPDETLSGRASFGFVAKYKKGAATPGGNTAFAFEIAGFEFQSSSYDWLVVNQGGSNAQFKGSGTINDAPAPNGTAFRFMIWAGDGKSQSEPDTFRIKVWWEDNGVETVVYDNGAEQAIGGGNIVVHKGK